MTRTILIIVVVNLALGGLGFSIGYHQGKKQRLCYECCPEGEMCMNEEEWVAASIGQVDDQAVSKELSRLLDVCWAERDANLANEREVNISEMPIKMKLGLELAECRGALEECRRD